MTNILINIKCDKNLCGNCEYLERISNCYVIGASEEAYCQLFGDLDGEDVGLISERIFRDKLCLESEVNVCKS